MDLKNLQFSSGYHQNLQASAHHGQKLLQPVWILPLPYYHLQRTPNNMMIASYVRMMNVEQTANWVRSCCAHRGWQEATVYATSFRKNSINGEMLQHLNHEILKFDMGISNARHRLQLLAIIQQLFPSYSHKVFCQPTTLSALRKRNTKWNHRQKAVVANPGHSKPVEGGLRAAWGRNK